MQPAMFRLPLRSPWLACLALYAASTGAAARESSTNITTSDDAYHDCSDVPSYMSSGIYTLRPDTVFQEVEAYCDMDEDGGGWTVLIRRNDTEEQEYFYRDWDSYKLGFGHLEEEFYWGNENMWMLVSHPGRRYQVHIWLEDWDNDARHALYQDFKIGSESGTNYTLHIGNYSGDAGDSFSRSNNSQFSTFDRDNDEWNTTNCALRDQAAWWYWSCTYSQLTGKYYDGGYSGYPQHGIVWYGWKVEEPYSLKAAVMKIKPSDKE